MAKKKADTDDQAAPKRAEDTGKRFQPTPYLSEEDGQRRLDVATGNGPATPQE